MIKYLENESFDDYVKDGIVLADFYATWCGPCKMLSPVLEELDSDRSEVKILKVDVDKHEDLAKRFRVMSVPTIIYFKNGKEVDKSIGFLPKDEIQKKINDLN